MSARFTENQNNVFEYLRDSGYSAVSARGLLKHAQLHLVAIDGNLTVHYSERFGYWVTEVTYS
jgi:hypothetical protein